MEDIIILQDKKKSQDRADPGGLMHSLKGVSSDTQILSIMLSDTLAWLQNSCCISGHMKTKQP